MTFGGLLFTVRIARRFITEA